MAIISGLRGRHSSRTPASGDSNGGNRIGIAAIGRDVMGMSIQSSRGLPRTAWAALDVTIVPLGEGQWDLEIFGEIGHSFWPAPVYAELWLGYRERLANTTTFKDPGAEYVFLAESGVNPSSRTLLKATLDGFAGRNWVVEGIQTSSLRRILTPCRSATRGGIERSIAVGPRWTVPIRTGPGGPRAADRWRLGPCPAVLPRSTASGETACPDLPGPPWRHRHRRSRS